MGTVNKHVKKWINVEWIHSCNKHSTLDNKIHVCLLLGEIRNPKDDPFPEITESQISKIILTCLI